MFEKEIFMDKQRLRLGLAGSLGRCAKRARSSSGCSSRLQVSPGCFPRLWKGGPQKCLKGAEGSNGIIGVQPFQGMVGPNFNLENEAPLESWWLWFNGGFNPRRGAGFGRRFKRTCRQKRYGTRKSCSPNLGGASEMFMFF